MVLKNSEETVKITTVAPQAETGDKLRYQVANLQGMGLRERQEDSFTAVNAIDEEKYDNYGLMFAVCDGMGGMLDGKLASETAISSFRRSFSQMDRSGKIAEQVRASVFDASREVEKLLNGVGGTTGLIAVIIHEQLYFASAGDSFLYLKRDGMLYRLNMSQDFCHQLYLENIRSGNFDPKECREDIQAAALAQFLGMRGFAHADCSVRPLALKRGDTLIACSDGVGGVLSQKELSDILDYPFGEDACRQIEQCIIEHADPNQDNYTAFIVKCV